MGKLIVPHLSQLPCTLGCTSANKVRAQGVRLVFYNDESDILLLQQMSEIPRDFKPFFMGGSCFRVVYWRCNACAVLQRGVVDARGSVVIFFSGTSGWALVHTLPHANK